MRQIKFRVWYITEKEMIYPDLYWFEEEGVREVPGDAHGYQVMQFTGLVDKHGKEIFEGDIVKHSNGTETSLIEDIHAFCGECGIYGDNPRDVEVIGNLYENGDLLK